MTKFGLDQIQSIFSIFRRQIECSSNDDFCLGVGNTLGKGRSVGYQHLVYFPCLQCFFFSLLSKQQILDSSKLKEFAGDNLNLMKMAESSPRGGKHCWKRS